MKEKERFRKAPPNYAMKKTQLLKEKVRDEMPASLVQSLVLKNGSSSGFWQYSAVSSTLPVQLQGASQGSLLGSEYSESSQLLHPFFRGNCQQ